MNRLKIYLGKLDQTFDFNFYLFVCVSFSIISKIKFQNMFLAIINDSYVVVKEEMDLEKEDFEVGDYLKRGYNNVLVSLC
jgi:hypothetical protein